jgi:hypothetical protein
MKNYIKILALAMVAVIVTSCLDGDQMNTPPGGSKPFIMMTNNSTGGTLVNSGVRYFGAETLLLNPAEANDTLTFAVTLQGTSSYDKDINVTIATPADALDDVNDGLTYAFMPTNGYNLLSTSGVIPKGKTYAEFQVVFHPNVIDLTKNFMLPITVSNDAGLTVSSNYGYIYYHIIGNALAGAYTWKYRRYNSADTTAATAGTANGVAIFAPKDATTIETSGGYASTVGLNAPYIITFTKNDDGTLSDIKVAINTELANGMTENGITITKAPAFIKQFYSPTNKHFKIWYTVVNSSGGTRVLIDEYWLP